MNSKKFQPKLIQTHSIPSKLISPQSIPIQKNSNGNQFQSNSFQYDQFQSRKTPKEINSSPIIFNTINSNQSYFPPNQFQPVEYPPKLIPTCLIFICIHFNSINSDQVDLKGVKSVLRNNNCLRFYKFFYFLLCFIKF